MSYPIFKNNILAFMCYLTLSAYILHANSDINQYSSNTATKILNQNELESFFKIMKGEKRLYITKGVIDNKDITAFVSIQHTESDGDISVAVEYNSLDTNLQITKIGVRNGALIFYGITGESTQSFELIQDMKSKINKLSLVSNDLHKKKLDYHNNATWSCYSHMEKLFIPNEGGLRKSVYAKLNKNLSLNAMNIRGLKHILFKEMKAQCKDIEFNMEYIQATSIYYLDSNIIILEQGDYSYEGGANGNYSTSMKAYSLNSGDELPNDIYSLFDKSKNMQLLSIINKKLKDSKEHIYTYPLTIKDLPHTFFIDSKNVKFVWQPYEIAGRAMGVISIEIPLGKLKRLIKKDSPYGYLFE